VRLEQNYRSTGTILAGANAVVKNNSKRKDKTLWTEKPKGEPIRLVLVQDEEDVGRFVVVRMTRAVQKEGRSLRHLAVLYRTNAQSRAIENALRRAAIPYELVGGIPFYQRREVKDLLAYLRLAVNEADDLAFRRVFNVPRRGLGKTTLDRLAAMAFLKGVSLMVAARTIRQEPELTSSAREKISAFLEVVEGVKSRMNEPVGEVLLSLVQTLDYGTYLTENEPDTAAERRENVEELIVGARQFSERVEEPTVEAFLNEVSLLTDADRVDESAEKVRLMTAHNAKGLEFDTVFLTGLEEGLFPHASSAEDREELEEERRLFYVGMTRAREQVFLTAAAARRRFWASGSSQLSRFVREIPSEFIEADVRVSDLAPFASGARPARPAGQTSRLKRSRTEGEEIQLGPRHVVGRIIHPTFGAGDVVAQEGTGPEARLTVLFGGGVMKKIVARYAQWEESDVDF
jgi:DNA helicase-2/ATP-dependent DNA helicase PcrA